MTNPPPRSMCRTFGALWLLAMAFMASPWTARANAQDIVDMPVTMYVSNLNRTPLPCPSPAVGGPVDGKRYKVVGRLVAPRDVLDRPAGNRSITLLLARLVLSGEDLWHFDAVPGYDFSRELAALGHATFLYDQLGGGASDVPNGNSLCIPSDADVAHQVVAKLRTGDYHVASGPAPRFKRIAVLGLSTSSAVAEVEAYSFHDADALVETSWADQGMTPELVLLPRKPPCPFGGPRFPGGPGGYTLFGGGRESEFLYDVDPRVFAAIKRAHELDSCGVIDSFPTVLTLGHAYIPRIRVPVLVAGGDKDSFFYPFGFRLQTLSFTGSRDVSLMLFHNAGHGFTLERRAASYRAAIASWLSARGF